MSESFQSLRHRGKDGSNVYLYEVSGDRFVVKLAPADPSIEPITSGDLPYNLALSRYLACAKITDRASK